MRTTINLPDDLLVRVKRLSADSRTSVTAFIEDAVREALARRSKRVRAAKAELQTYGEKGLQPGIDLDDSVALLDALENT
ncbi:MAG: ribbon-helix-helix domain-containing protein [Pseudomonadota bacterium]|nr:ribbon-helix-helix domain-containing protein [Pseudomonadota bacterium]